MSAQMRVRQPKRSGVRGKRHEVVFEPEHELRDALAPLATKVRGTGVEILCEVLAGVGTQAVGRAGSLRRLVEEGAIRALASSGPEVWVRVARQFAGFDPTSKVLVSVATRGQTEHLELAMPGTGEEEPPPIAARRLLVVVPSLRGARIQQTYAVRAGSSCVTSFGPVDAVEAMRSAVDRGAPFDAVYVDDALRDDGLALVTGIRRDGALGSPTVLVASATEASADLERFRSAGAHGVLPKPVLPSDLREALAALGPPSERQVRAMRVLVAEDDPIVGRISESAVRKLGHEPVRVASGRDAAEQLASGGFDAALIDVGLPELDGLSVARFVRRHQPDMTLVIVSAAHIGDAERAAAGVDAVLEKPLQPGRLAELLGAVKKVA